METETLDMLEQSLTDVLERFAFMFAEPQSLSELAPPSSDLCRATIRFTGPRCGALSLISGVDVGEQLAANILGLEPRLINREAGDDSFKELLNVTCGEFLERLRTELRRSPTGDEAPEPALTPARLDV